MGQMRWASTLGILSWQSRMNSTRAPMSHPLERYALRPVRSPREWSAYHAIRRDAIFSVLLPGQVYDEHDPDEFEHRHLPHVLVCDGEIIGKVSTSSARHKRALVSSPSAAIYSGKATAAFCCASRKTPRAASAGPRSSSTPTRRR